MQAPPAHAGMYLHGILHRIEGDYSNALAWYSDVSGSEVFQAVWGEEQGGLEGAKRFIAGVERLRKEGKGEREGLERESEREIRGVVGWCVERWGKGEWRDARGEWSQPDERHRKMGNDMVVGGEGWRKF